jgi:hypothetical protein
MVSGGSGQTSGMPRQIDIMLWWIPVPKAPKDIMDIHIARRIGY